MHFVCYYRAPDGNIREFSDDIETKMSAPVVNKCFVGDLNINHQKGRLVEGSNLEYDRMITSYGFEIVNSAPTRPLSGRMLDHFVTNMSEKFQISNETIDSDPNVV